jgi:KDO2-lipid IV(A) lauroyltransferase
VNLKKTGTPMQKFFQQISYLGLRLGSGLLMLLPLKSAYFLAGATGGLAHLLGFRRRIVLANLRAAFGNEMNEKELRELAARSYQQIAMTFLELVIAPKLRGQIKRMLEPEQVILVQQLLDRRKGLIAITGHLGNWELQGAGFVAALQLPITVVARRQSNPAVDRYITERRNELGMEVVDLKASMKPLLQAMKNHKPVGLVADQRAGRNAVHVDFFGKTAATHPGPAQLVLKYGAPLVFMAAIRKGPGQFAILFREIPVRENDTVESLTRRHVKVLEEFIRQYPEQYFWLHQRWKITKWKNRKVTAG